MIIFASSMKRAKIIISLFYDSLMATAQQYQVPVSEVHEKMKAGKYQPTWQSLKTHQTPEWFRDAKFGEGPVAEKAILLNSKIVFGSISASGPYG